MRSEEEARVQRIHDARRDQLAIEVRKAEEWLELRRYNTSERDRKIMPARQGRLDKDRERLQRLGAELETQLEAIRARRPGDRRSAAQRRTGAGDRMTVAGYGIDFGTTNSAIAIAYDDDVQVVNVEPTSQLTTMLPSMCTCTAIATDWPGRRQGSYVHDHWCEQTRLHALDLVTFQGGEADTLCRTYVRGGGCQDSRLLAGLKLDLAMKRLLVPTVGPSTSAWTSPWPSSFGV